MKIFVVVTMILSAMITGSVFTSPANTHKRSPVFTKPEMDKRGVYKFNDDTGATYNVHYMSNHGRLLQPEDLQKLLPQWLNLTFPPGASATDNMARPVVQIEKKIE